ncbi:MAG: hypothetical protein H7288_09330 [Kineosporiaceae bacterium]|nr:hypothetical protein [Aeromicrobium sp.]
MSDLFLAVDGGQSGTVAVVGLADGTIVGVGRGGPIRHHEEPDAERFVRQGISSAVAEAMNGAQGHGAVAVCCLAMTGSTGIAQRVVRDVVAAKRYITLESDILAALASGTGGGGGVGLIAGTGTVAIAKSRNGEHIIRGGWGWLLGDEGGGFWIAMEALKAAARDVDGTGPSTVLTSTLPGLLGQQDLREVYNLITGQRLDRTAVAALTTTVVTTAEGGDGVAAGILDGAARHLTTLVLATIASAPFLTPDERVIVACGGVLNPGGWVISRVTEQLAERAPEFGMIAPAVPPVIGAYYLALTELGNQVGAELMTHVTDQVRSLPALIAKTPSASPDQHKENADVQQPR